MPILCNSASECVWNVYEYHHSRVSKPDEYATTVHCVVSYIPSIAWGV